MRFLTTHERCIIQPNKDKEQMAFRKKKDAKKEMQF